MRRSGKAHWLVIVSVLVIVVGLVVVLVPTRSPSAVTSEFFAALAEGNVDRLTELTYWSGDREELREKWRDTIEVSQHYRFVWRVVSEKIATDDTAGVVVEVFRNATAGNTFEEKFDIPLHRQDGKWRVDVRGINRELYPFLPR